MTCFNEVLTEVKCFKTVDLTPFSDCCCISHGLNMFLEVPSLKSSSTPDPMMLILNIMNLK